MIDSILGSSDSSRIVANNCAAAAWPIPAAAHSTAVSSVRSGPLPDKVASSSPVAVSERGVQNGPCLSGTASGKTMCGFWTAKAMMVWCTPFLMAHCSQPCRSSVTSTSNRRLMRWSSSLVEPERSCERLPAIHTTQPGGRRCGPQRPDSAISPTIFLMSTSALSISSMNTMPPSYSCRYLPSSVTHQKGSVNFDDTRPSGCLTGTR